MLSCSASHTTEEEDALPGQVERAGADVDVEVTFGEGATQLLQMVPSVPVQVRVLE